MEILEVSQFYSYERESDAYLESAQVMMAWRDVLIGCSSFSPFRSVRSVRSLKYAVISCTPCLPGSAFS